MAAVRDKFYSNLEQLLEQGVSPDTLSEEAPGERRTLLCLTTDAAIQTGDTSIVQLLLDKKADPNKPSETGTFPLTSAVKAGKLELVRMMLKGRADLGVQEDPAKRISALHHAVCKPGDPRMLDMLLRAKANVDLTNFGGNSPLFFAASEAIAEKLLAVGADYLHTNERGQTAVHFAAATGCFSVITTLICRAPELLDSRDEAGRTPLHVAAAKGHLGAVQTLLDAGAQAKAETHKGSTPMTLAYAKDHTQVAYYLYCRVLGSRHSTWSEWARNPPLLFMLAILGATCFTNRELFVELFYDMMGW